MNDRITSAAFIDELEKISNLKALSRKVSSKVKELLHAAKGMRNTAKFAKMENTQKRLIADAIKNNYSNSIGRL